MTTKKRPPAPVLAGTFTTIKNAAAFFDMGISNFYQKQKTGEVPQAVKLGGLRLVAVDELLEFRRQLLNAECLLPETDSRELIIKLKEILALANGSPKNWSHQFMIKILTEVSVTVDSARKSNRIYSRI